MEVVDKENSNLYLGATDNIAFGIIEALREKNIKIPYEISPLMNPPLKTVAFSYEKLGKLAIESLIDVIEGNKSIKARQVEPKLIIRSSCK